MSVLYYPDQLVTAIRLFAIGACFMLVASGLLKLTLSDLKEGGHVRFLYGIFQFLILGSTLLFSAGIVYMLVPMELFDRSMELTWSGQYLLYGWVYLAAGLVIGILWLAGLLWNLHLIGKDLKIIRQVNFLSNPENRPEVIEQYYGIADQLQIRRVPDLFTNPGYTSAYISGLRHSMIVIPSSGYDEADRSLSMCHELIHYKEHHLWIRFLVRALSVCYWFLPGRAFLIREVKEIQETICDLEACEAMSQAMTASEYYNRILMLSVRKRKVPADVIAAGLLEDYHQLERRISNMFQVQTGKRRKGLRAAVAACMLTLLIAFVCLDIVSPDLLRFHEPEIIYVDQDSPVSLQEEVQGEQ